MPPTIAPDSVRPVAVDLFAGAGGLSLGFEMAGFDVLSAVEYDPVHAATHLYNFPLSDVLCRDVARVTADDVLQSARRGWDLHHPDGPSWDGEIDVLVGGPSCQGFSVMGKQDANDERNQLVLEFVRLVEELRPRTFVMENVPGFLHERFAPLREEALSRMRAAGYSVSGESGTLAAVDFGVPQRRKRVVIAGSRVGEAPRRPEPTSERPVTVGEALFGLPELSSADTVDADVLILTQIQRELLEGSKNAYLLALRPEGEGNLAHPRIDDYASLSGCRLTVHQQRSIDRFSAVGQGGVDEVSRAYRLSEALPARTLRAGTGRERGAFSASRPLHPTKNRVITVREAARLHSFPDWFRFHTTNWHGHRQIGNAVPPLLAKAVAESVLMALSRTTFLPTVPVRLGDGSLLSLSPTSAALTLTAVSAEVPRSRRRAIQQELVGVTELTSSNGRATSGVSGWSMGEGARHPVAVPVV